MKLLFILQIRSLHRIISVLAVVVLSVVFASSQSSDLRFPTPVRKNEIIGTIKARDVGDSRLTTYYYTFEGEQGDLFVNVQSRNFTGDVDVYILAGQRPLTKIVTYADIAENETGRVIYLRRPERILLRIEGRSPGDEDASIRIKFAGSFAASRLEDSLEPAMPKTSAENETGVRVNSVGTILEVIPKVNPTPDAVAEKAEAVEPKADVEKRSSETEAVAEIKEPEKAAETKKTEVIVTDPLGEREAETATKTTTTNRRNRRARNTPPLVEKPAETADGPAQPTGAEVERKTTVAERRRARRAAAAAEKKERAPDPMAGVNLVIQFKDGGTIERPMNEVLKFSVERAVLTVISKNGSIGRYQMTDVVSVTIR